MSQEMLFNKNMSKLKKELKEFNDQGISLILDGNPSTPNEIVKACRLAEKGTYTYMRDYVADEEGVINQIHFDLVK